MKRAKNDYEVTAPNGERFVVGWASPRDVERTFGKGRWGVEVMRRDGRLSMPTVLLDRVSDSDAGEAELRRLASVIQSGEWKPLERFTGPSRLREVPRWTVAPVAFVGWVLLSLGFGHELLPSVVGAAFGALLLLILTTAFTWGSRRS